MFDINNKLILAPMAGITDIAFRELCLEFGADITITEMISCRSLLYKSTKVWKIGLKPKIGINGIQLFADKPEIFEECAIKCKDFISKFDFVDINMGCPATKILKSKSGSYLMKDPVTAGKCVKALVDNLDIPVSVKMRIGFEDQKNFIEVAKECLKNGAMFISLHGRTVEQGYSGLADLEKIKDLTNTLKIPVIGNGDIKNKLTFDKMKKTNCNSYMIGREAIGNPLIFAILKNKKNNLNAISLFYKYLEKALKYKLDFKLIRQQAIFFMKGFDGASKIRGDLVFARSINEIKNLLENINN